MRHRAAVEISEDRRQHATGLVGGREPTLLYGWNHPARGKVGDVAGAVTPGPRHGSVQRDVNAPQGGYFSAGYQPTRDGKRILTTLPDRNDFQLVISPDWITEFRRRVPESSGRK
ncbi:MAG: hypothetical protein ACRELE_04225 [Gemmatimonadales bacterium]